MYAWLNMVGVHDLICSRAQKVASLALNSITELTKAAAPCTSGLVDLCGVFDVLPIARWMFSVNSVGL